MDIFKKLTPAERDAEVAAARARFDKAPSAHQHLVSASDEDFIDLVESAIELAAPVVVAARPLTAQEEAALNGKLTMMRVFGDSVDDETSIIPAFAKLEQEQAQRDLEELVGPAVRARKAAEATLEGMIEQAIKEALRKGAGAASRSEAIVIPGHSIPVRRAPLREGIAVKLAAVADEHDPGSVLSRWLRGYVAADESTMRAAVRELVTSEAA